MDEKKLRVAFVTDENTKVSPAVSTPSVVTQNIPSSNQSVVSPKTDNKPSTVPSSTSGNTEQGRLPSYAAVTSNSSSVKQSNNISDNKELIEARETIRKLQAACDTYTKEIERLNGLRQRRTGGDDTSSDSRGSSGSKSQMQVHHTEGIPLMFVLFLVGLAFVLGVVFF